MAERTYQVVIWGGTGFVGKLVAEHIARDYAVSQQYKISTFHQGYNCSASALV